MPAASVVRKLASLYFSRRKTVYLVNFTVLIASAAFLYALWTRPFAATTRLLIHDNAFADANEAAEFATSVTCIPSLDRLAGKLIWPTSGRELAQNCWLTFDFGNSSLIVLAQAGNSGRARELADALAAHTSTCATEWMGKRIAEADERILSVERRLHELRKQFSHFDTVLTAGDVAFLQRALEKEVADQSAAAGALQTQLAAIDAEERKLSSSLMTEQPALQSLQQELERALTRYTEDHPQVKELRGSITALEKESAARVQQRTTGPRAELKSKREAVLAQLRKAEAAESKSRLALQTFAANSIELTRAQSEFAALNSRREELIQTRATAAAKGVDIFRPSGRIEMGRVTDFARLRDYSLLGAFSGLGMAGITVVASARRRRVIRDARSLREATGLPVLAELPSLESLDENARDFWAVETLERLRSAVGSKRRGSFVCGIISSSSGEGRSTWIDLLAKASLRSGHRVFVISQPRGASVPQLPDASSTLGDNSDLNSHDLFVPSAATPTAVARYSLTPQISHVRFQENWENAFAKWQHEENAVILVELPPASTADGLLQSRSVPNVLWLGAANVADTSKTLRCVTGLRNTGCNLIGAALNMCPASTRRWAALGLLLFASFLNLSAQEAKPVTNALSKTKVPVLDPWQEKLTLGPGDVFDISLYGQPDSLRSGVTIAPDGRFNYLQAADVLATGLTVDELRAKLEGILGKFHVSPRVIIVPQAFHSKKYFVLGNVAQRGVFTLDRPTTIVEAVARAHGFAMGNQQRSSFSLADLSHAFLMRRQANGEFARESVDFEALFQQGQLQHNKLLAPDDYLYFPPLGLEEVYVLGEVRSVGVTPYVKNLSALGAIASRGGFTEGAFRQKILVVRGSLEKPETFVVDLQSTLRAQSPDFALQPRDIVYVSRKPWAKAQELLEAASSDFVRALAVTWTGREISPKIQ